MYLLGNEHPMKGTVFQKPFEFRLQIGGESWNQGDALDGSLSIKNHGTTGVNDFSPQLHIAQANLKKAHQKKPGAFDIVGTVELDPQISLGVGEEKTLSWKFTTDRNCTVTDHLQSLFVLYGTGKPETMGALQLQIQPYSLLQDFIRAIEIQHRFVTKSKKTVKGWLEVKMEPPASKAFMLLEQLVLKLKMENDDLEAHYKFEVKKIQATPGSVDTSKTVKEVSQSFTPREYRLESGRIHLEKLETAIGEALSEVQSKIVF